MTTSETRKTSAYARQSMVLCHKRQRLFGPKPCSLLRDFGGGGRGHYLPARSTSRAARRPLSIAPATVPVSSLLVASPAKNSVPRSGLASASCAPEPPTPAYEYAQRLNGSRSQS